MIFPLFFIVIYLWPRKFFFGLPPKSFETKTENEKDRVEKEDK